MVNPTTKVSKPVAEGAGMDTPNVSTFRLRTFHHLRMSKRGGVQRVAMYGPLLDDDGSRRSDLAERSLLTGEQQAMNLATVRRTSTASPYATAVKEEFLRKFSGWFAFKLGNEGFENRSMLPLINVAHFEPAASDSAADMAAAKARIDAWVTMCAPLVPVKLTVAMANQPFLLTYSSACHADAAGHVFPKIRRNSLRHIQLGELRDMEFSLRKEAKTGAKTIGASAFHRNKVTRERKRTMVLSSAEGEPEVAPGDEITAADALREQAAAGNRALCVLREQLEKATQEMMSAKPPKFEVVEEEDEGAAGPVPMLDGEEDGAASSASFTPSAPPPQTSAAAPSPPVATPASVGAAVDPVAAFKSTAGPPPPLLQGDQIPPQWMEKGVVVSSGTWPMHLLSRASYINITFIEDLDLPDDSPSHPKAAGMEPLCILWGGAFSTKEDATAVTEQYLAKFALGVDIDVVDMREDLFPTEVDHEVLKEAGQAGETHQGMMAERKRQLTQAGTARQMNEAQRAAGAPPLFAESAVVGTVPDIDDFAREGAMAGLEGNSIIIANTTDGGFDTRSEEGRMGRLMGGIPLSALGVGPFAAAPSTSGGVAAPEHHTSFPPPTATGVSPAGIAELPDETQ